jgi:hypothetical protein
VGHPDRAGRWSPASPRAAVGVTLVLAVLSAGCARISAPPTGDHAPDEPPSLPPASAVELVGHIRGPVSGLGDRAALHVVVRGDGAVWASIRRDPGPQGPAVHEVLVWAEDLALLFDRRTLRATELGQVPGEIEAWGGRFVGADALWLLGGVQPPGAGTATGWEKRSDQWRGRRGAEVGLRRPARDAWDWSEAVWRDSLGSVHALRAHAEVYTRLPEGRAWPSRLGLEGTDLDARVVVDWSQLRWHPALGDSILDPLWEPPRP